MQRIRIPTPAHAATIVAIGFPRAGLIIEPLHHTGTGEKSLTWHYAGPSAQEANDILTRLALPTDHPKHLARENPTHPAIAAWAGTQNAIALHRWIASPHTIPQIAPFSPGGPILTIQHTRADLMRDAGTRNARFGTVSIPFAAACIAAGFLPMPHLLTHEGQPAIAFPETSITFPGLDHHHVHQAMLHMSQPVAKEHIGSHVLPAFRPGQHPFHYAFAAAVAHASVPAIQERAWKSPTHFFKSPRTGKSALCNNQFLENRHLESKLQLHLAGL